MLMKQAPPISHTNTLQRFNLRVQTLFVNLKVSVRGHSGKTLYIIKRHLSAITKAVRILSTSCRLFFLSTSTLLQGPNDRPDYVGDIVSPRLCVYLNWSRTRNG